MANLTVVPPYELYSDIDGKPLESGYIYVGVAGLDAQTNPISVYWDSALTVPAAQPVRTISGYAANSGTPGELFLNAESFSITIKNKNGTTVFSELTVSAGNVASAAVTQPKFDTSTAVATTQFVQNALGNYYQASETTGSIILTAADAGEFLSVRSASVLNVTLPAIASVPLGANYTVSASESDVDLIAPDGQIDDLIGTTGSTLAIRHGNVVKVTKATTNTWIVENHVQTMAKFNNDTYVATTAFVQEAGHRFSAGLGIQMTVDPYDVTADQAGSWFNFGTGSGTARLPLLADCPSGLATYTFRSSIYAAIRPNATDEAAGVKIVNQHNSLVTFYGIKPGEFVTIVSDGASWWITSSGFGGDTFIGGSGYQQLPNGKIIQWGRSSFPGPGTFYATSSTAFPIAFPHTAESVTINAATQANGTPVGSSAYYIPIYAAGLFTAAGFTWACDTNAGIAITGTQVFNWFAVGY